MWLGLTIFRLVFMIRMVLFLFFSEVYTIHHPPPLSPPSPPLSSFSSSLLSRPLSFFFFLSLSTAHSRHLLVASQTLLSLRRISGLVKEQSLIFFIMASSAGRFRAFFRAVTIIITLPRSGEIPRQFRVL